MDAIAALYGSDASLSSTSSSSAESSDEDAALALHAGDSGAVGSSTHRKRKREDTTPSPPQWTRAFAHVEGNWPSHVSVVVGSSDDRNDSVLHALCSRVIDRTQQRLADTNAAPLVPMRSSDSDSLHLSLSRPFALRFEQISPFVDELRAALKWRRRFVLSLADATVLVNDERTRSFLALRVADGANDVVATVRCVDTCMQHFALPPYYEDPIPHVSIASCLGHSLPAQLPHDQVLELLQDEVPWITAVTTVHVAIGNRQFRISLQ